jgi:hypothetical protein
MKFKTALIILVVFFIQGCIPSLHPLWTQDKLVFDENLSGEWTQDESEGKYIWRFSGGFDEKKNILEEYELIYKEDKSEAKFEIHLVKLGDHLFFDIMPDDLEYLKFEDKTLGVPIEVSGLGNTKAEQPDIHLNLFYFEHMLPVHTFAKVEIEKDEVKIYRFDQEWLDDLFKQRKVRIKHEETSDEGIILTASTADLQKFFEKYADDEKAYLDPIILYRNQ